MTIELTGIVDHIGKIEPHRKGFKQVVILEQPERKDEFDRIIARAEYYPVSIVSSAQADSRFLGSGDIRSKRKAKCTLKGSRWMSGKGLSYGLYLNLSEWLS